MCDNHKQNTVIQTYKNKLDNFYLYLAECYKTVIEKITSFIIQDEQYISDDRQVNFPLQSGPKHWRFWLCCFTSVEEKHKTPFGHTDVFCQSVAFEIL